MGYLVPDKDDCRHNWVKMDKDDSFHREGKKHKVKRIYEICTECNKTRIRKVKKRIKRDIHGKRYY